MPAGYGAGRCGAVRSGVGGVGRCGAGPLDGSMDVPLCGRERGAGAGTGVLPAGGAAAGAPGRPPGWGARQ